LSPQVHLSRVAAAESVPLDASPAIGIGDGAIVVEALGAVVDVEGESSAVDVLTWPRIGVGAAVSVLDAAALALDAVEDSVSILNATVGAGFGAGIGDLPFGGTGFD